MTVGTVVSLWRYPVKSMMGEELNASHVTDLGLLGDRAYAVMDSATNKVASLKHPRKWKSLFDCRATYVQPPVLGGKLPPVRITLPDGRMITSEDDGVDQILSELVERDVKLQSPAPDDVSQEEYWPDIEGLAHREKVTEEAMPPRTFFDLAVLHILTTASIDRLCELYPKGRLEVRRFRPNIVVEPPRAESGFIEDIWIGRLLKLGDEVRVAVTAPCPRCVVITLPQGDLPSDPGILRIVAQHNRANLGVHAAVLAGGVIRRGDILTLV
jgi:uncharacterized protein YcbX